MLTKYDILIITIVLTLSVCSYAFVGLAVSTDTPEAVEIRVDGQLYGSYRLSPQVINLKTKFGNNTLKITPDGAEMIESDCKDKLDVRCGRITKVGQIIICIPNRVTVKLTGNNTDKVDKVTY